MSLLLPKLAWMFQHTAARRRLDFEIHKQSSIICFNTQPPEGGWLRLKFTAAAMHTFQHTAARRRLAGWGYDLNDDEIVSTHSRPKAAGTIYSKGY